MDLAALTIFRAVVQENGITRAAAPRTRRKPASLQTAKVDRSEASNA